MSAPAVRVWFVTYRVGRSVELWVEVRGVPARVKQAEVVERLEGWARWPALKARVGVLGRISVSSRLPAAVGAAFESVTWEDLAPVERIISLPVPSPLHAAAARAAASAGVSLRAFVLAAIEAAVGDD